MKFRVKSQIHDFARLTLVSSHSLPCLMGSRGDRKNHGVISQVDKLRP